MQGRWTKAGVGAAGAAAVLVLVALAATSALTNVGLVAGFFFVAVPIGALILATAAAAIGARRAQRARAGSAQAEPPSTRTVSSR